MLDSTRSGRAPLAPGRRRGADRHHGAERRRGRRPHRRARERGRIAPMRRSAPKVAVVGYPNVGKSALLNRSRWPAGARGRSPGHDARPQGDPRGVGRAHSSSSTPVAWTSSRGPRWASRSGTRRTRARRSGDTCWSPTQHGNHAGDADLADLLRSQKSRRPHREQAGTLARGGVGREFLGLGLGEPIPISAAHGNGTATSSTRWWKWCPSTARPTTTMRTHPHRRDRAAERRQVVVRERLPRRRARHRVRRRGHDARCDRHADRGPRAEDRARRHRRVRRLSKVGEGLESTPRCARSARPSAPTSRSWSATRRTASPPRTCGSRTSRCTTAARAIGRAEQVGRDGGDGDPLGPGGGVGAAELDAERARVNRKLRLRPRVLTASRA